MFSVRSETDDRRWCFSLLVVASGALLGALADSARSFAEAPRPNIVHIFADDLGKGSIGIHGQNARAAQGLPSILTPNLDALAVAGMTFHRAYAATVCSPSRGMLMTGFHQGHGHNDRNVQAFRAADVTVAQLLQDGNYSTGLFGKWGYGGSGGQNPNGVDKEFDLRHSPTITNVNTLPTSKGYQEFLGYLNHSRAHRYFVSSLWSTDPTGNPQTAGLSEFMLGNQNPNDPNHNLQATYSHDVIAQRSEQFVAEHYQSAEPFYMQVNYTIPHNDLEAIQYVPDWFDAYSGIDTSGWSDKERFYAAMITRMDTSIGSLIGRLEDPNGDGDTSDSVLDNTIILFTSDNGATDADFSRAGLDHFGLNDSLRGGKRDLWEGGINVPLIVRWDGHVAAGASSDLLTDLADFMATAADLAGVSTPVGIDGVSIVPTLTGAGIQRDRGYLIFEHHEGDGPDPDSRNPRWTIIRGDQKLIRFANGDYELYDLASDPRESNPLDLSVSVNAALRLELEAIAVAEGVNQADSYANQFQSWIGSHGDELVDSSRWIGTATGGPADNWSAVINNHDAAESIITTGGNATMLGIEVRGDQAGQTVRVDPSRVLTGRNEIRIQNGGRVHLDGATLASSRWVDIASQGELTGLGRVEGHVFNQGRIAPGLPDDLAAIDAGDVGNVDTGVVTAIVFDFAGIQDNAPLTQTSVLNENLQLATGLSFGPGVHPRNAANAGNEFNVTGFLNQTQEPSSLAHAIAAEDYLTFTIAAIPGVAMTLDSVHVNLWRNGSGAAEQYAIFTSLDGFVDGTEIGSLAVFDSGSTNQHELIGQYGGGVATTDPVEIRIYGWDANGNSGNTHFNAVSLTASFVSVPFVPLAPTGELLLMGDYHQLPSGVLAIDLAGVDNSDPQAMQYDVLRVAGRAILDGALEVSLADTDSGQFAPSLGDAFQILTADVQLVGQFSGVNLPSLAQGLSWDLVYDEHTLTLLVVENLPGDYNKDSIVDAADYVLWRRTFGQSGASLPADGDRNGEVDIADYDLWRAHYGSRSLDAVALQAPEPGTSLLLFVAGALFFLTRADVALPSAKVSRVGRQRFGPVSPSRSSSSRHR